MTVFDRLPDVFTNSLGVPVVYTRAGEAAVMLNGIVSRRASDLMFDGPDSVSNKVTVAVRSADVPALSEGDLFAVPLDGVTFIGKAVQPIRSDGKGMTKVTLAANS